MAELTYQLIWGTLGVANWFNSYFVYLFSVSNLVLHKIIAFKTCVNTYNAWAMLADGGLEAVHSGESVHKTHLTVQHGAGLGEILNHFLSANSVIPLCERQKDRTVKLICMVHVSNCGGGGVHEKSISTRLTGCGRGHRTCWGKESCSWCFQTPFEWCSHPHPCQGF